MKKLLYIGHNYHSKTKSTQFLKDLLASKYEIDYFSFDPVQKKISFDGLQKKYDVVVLFQVMPSLKLLKKHIAYDHGIFFPMFDFIPKRDNFRWYEYREFRIINFSKTLHEELQALGFDSHYFQYFPKPVDSFDFGDEKSLFFWQRTNEIDTTMVEKTVNVDLLNKLYIHKAVDPYATFVEPRKKILPKCSFSSWFEKKEEMLTLIQKSALYFAPRKFEGIGLSFLEAMAMGRCVIAPNLPTMNEYIVNNETGFLYDYDNPRQIALKDIQRIQKNAYEYIKQGYQEWEKKKFEILPLLELPVVQNVQRETFIKPLNIAGVKIPFMTVLNFSYKKKYCLFDCVTLLKIVPNNTGFDCYLFDFILLFTLRDLGYKKNYSVFNKIPFFKIFYSQYRTKYYLFDFILLLSIEKEV